MDKDIIILYKAKIFWEQYFTLLCCRPQKSFNHDSLKFAFAMNILMIILLYLTGIGCLR